MQPSRLGIALLGHGTVGRGVVQLLAARGDELRRRMNLAFDLRHVVVRDPAKHADARGLPLTTDADAAVADDKVDVVVELVGGVGRAGELVTAALEGGKHVVTANKALLAARGPELIGLARSRGVCLAFEASCAGGVPIVSALLGGLAANRIDALVGILNGTSNVILSAMTAGQSYADALADAQAAGFAEADPTLDVNGRDAAQKLAILAGLAWGERVSDGDIHVEGIDTLDATDIAFAAELGYVVKLLAVARRDADGKAALSVVPTLVPAGDPLADVVGPFNATATYGDALGRCLLVGRGAGRMPTASAVVADLIAVASGGYAATFARGGRLPDASPPADVLAFAQTSHRYYLRVEAFDAPGVMAELTRCLGEAGISLSAVRQRESGGGDTVPIVITTHAARELSLQQAAAAINALPGTRGKAAVLRMMDLPEESDD